MIQFEYIALPCCMFPLLPWVITHSYCVLCNALITNIRITWINGFTINTYHLSVMCACISPSFLLTELPPKATSSSNLTESRVCFTNTGAKQLSNFITQRQTLKLQNPVESSEVASNLRRDTNHYDTVVVISTLLCDYVLAAAWTG